MSVAAAAGFSWADYMSDQDSADEQKVDAEPTADAAPAASPEVTNAGGDEEDGFTKVPSKEARRKVRRAKTRRPAIEAYKHSEDTNGITGRLRGARVVRMHRGAIEFLRGRHAGCQMPFYSLEQRLKALERLEEDGFLRRRDSTRRYRTTKAVDEMLETKRKAASAKRAHQQGAAAAQRARQRKAEADADARARLVAAAAIDPVFVPDETASDHGPVGAAATPVAVPPVFVHVVMTREGIPMAVMPYGLVPLANTYVAY